MLSNDEEKVNNSTDSSQIDPIQPIDDHQTEVKTSSLPSKHIIEILIESARDSTTHGIPHFFKRANSIIRLVWAICFFSSAIVCNYMIIQSIINYFQFNTVTKVQRVDTFSTEFPTVSICNLNAYMTNESNEFVKSVLEENNLVHNVNSSQFFNAAFESQLRALKFIVALNVYTHNLTDFDRSKFGYDLKDMLLSCTYNLKSCSADDFERYYDFYYGNCFKFNSGWTFDT